MRTESRAFLVGICVAWCCACASARLEKTGDAGTLLIVGGGLDNDSRQVYQRLLALASAHGPANLLVATAATGEEADEVIDKTQALRVWANGVPVGSIGRATSTADTVALIDLATGILFTGGDQKRITARYRPADQDTPEWLAMRRLLARGGVIAGCSAGDAMMGDVMLLTGGSAAALGIAPSTASGGEPPALGPQIGKGMHFLSMAMTDSHFFERDRLGRLVAALEQSGQRLGIGVGEDACVEIDLATGMLTGVSVSESLLVDVGQIKRDGLRRTNVIARVIGEGDRVALRERLFALPVLLPAGIAGATHEVPVVEPGQNRQLAMWRMFRCAAAPGSGAQRLMLAGWQVTAWPAGNGEVVFEVAPR